MANHHDDAVSLAIEWREMSAELTKVREQRDELIAALRSCVTYAKENPSFCFDPKARKRAWFVEAEAALKKAEGTS